MDILNFEDYLEATEHFKFLTARNLPLCFLIPNLEDLSKKLGIDFVRRGIEEKKIDKLDALRFYACDVLSFFNKIKSLNDGNATNLLTKESLAIWGLELGRDGNVQMGPKIQTLLSL